MSDISELQRRITSALDRIGGSLDALASNDTAALSAELEAERTANAQLEERVRAIKETQETTLAALESEVAQLKAALESTDAELQQTRSVNAELRTSNAALRDANAKGLADAGLVNSAMQAELDALRVAQSGDRAEIDRVLALLDPVRSQGETAHA